MNACVGAWLSAWTGTCGDAWRVHIRKEGAGSYLELTALVFFYRFGRNCTAISGRAEVAMVAMVIPGLASNTCFDSLRVLSDTRRYFTLRIQTQQANNSKCQSCIKCVGGLLLAAA